MESRPGQRKPSNLTSQGRSPVKSLENYSTFQILLLRNSANIIKFQNHNERGGIRRRRSKVRKRRRRTPDTFLVGIN